MFTVGFDATAASASRERCRAPSAARRLLLRVASLCARGLVDHLLLGRARAAALVGEAVDGRIAPSEVTSVSSACTRWNAGLSRRARSPSGRPSRGRGPTLAARDELELDDAFRAEGDGTVPSRSCAALGMKTPCLLSASTTSGLRTTCGKCGDPISSSPSATSTRLTGNFGPRP